MLNDFFVYMYWFQELHACFGRTSTSFPFCKAFTSSLFGLALLRIVYCDVSMMQLYLQPSFRQENQLCIVYIHVPEASVHLCVQIFFSGKKIGQSPTLVSRGVWPRETTPTRGKCFCMGSDYFRFRWLRVADGLGARLPWAIDNRDSLEPAPDGLLVREQWSIA